MSFLGLGDKVNDQVATLLHALATKQVASHVFAGVEEEESVIANADAWSACIIYEEPTADGVLGTMVQASRDIVVVTVELRRTIGQPLLLVRHGYSDGTNSILLRHNKKSPKTVRHVREFVRKVALPEVVERRARREAERTGVAKDLASLQKKYLP